MADQHCSQVSALLGNRLRHASAQLGDATQPIYDRIGVLARDAREEGRKQLVAKPLQERVDRAEELWAQLTPYYTSTSAPT